MGFMASKKATLVIIIFLASLLSASSSGRQPKLMDKTTAQVRDVTKEPPKIFSRDEGSSGSHSRILAVKTNDYGRYDPAPTFGKPPFKLIPN